MPESNKDPEQGLIVLSGTGSPFKDASKARMHMARHGWTDFQYSIVPIEGGFGLKKREVEISSEEPKPEKLRPTNNKVEFEGQEKKAPSVAVKPPAIGSFSESYPKMTIVTPETEKYWIVRFTERSSQMEPEDVFLGCNGEGLICRRGENVCIPDRFKRVAETAQRPHYKNIPGQDRKVLSPINTFPFAIIGEGSRAQYDSQKEEGRKSLVASGIAV